VRAQINAAMEAQCTEEHKETADDVTAVTSECKNRFAQRRADALKTMAETGTAVITHEAPP